MIRAHPRAPAWHSRISHPTVYLIITPRGGIPPAPRICTVPRLSELAGGRLCYLSIGSVRSALSVIYREGQSEAALSTGGSPKPRVTVSTRLVRSEAALSLR